MTLRQTLGSSLFVALTAGCSGSSDGIMAPAQGGSGGRASTGGGAMGATGTTTAGGSTMAGSGSGSGGAGLGGNGNSGTAGSGGAAGGTAGGGGNASTGGSAGTGPSGTGGSTSSKDGGSAGNGIDGAAPPPTDGGPPDIPMPTGACPDFVQGDVTFNPPGGARRVAMTLSDASRTVNGGPLIFYWFATTSNPTEARRGLPMAEVTAAGGIVVAPYDVAGAGTYPWLSQLTQHDALFDEVLACAVQKTKISTSRIHSVGFSAGALMTTHLSFARSKYLASVATYSGGAMGTFQETNNKFAAMIMTGGMSDIVVNNFYTSSQQWFQTLKTGGHFAMFCDHGGGHSIPVRLVPGVWQFFVDHPYGRVPSPYQGHLPGAIAPPCIE